MMYKESIAGVIFCFFLWLLMFFVAKRQSRRVYRQNNTSIYRLLFVVTVLYSTFAFTSGDYYSYHGFYDEMVRFNGVQEYMESFYFWLSQILPESYHLWRFVIWGLSTFLLVALFKKLQLNPQFASLLFVLMLLVYYVAPRNSLGYVALYLGIACTLCPSKKKVVSRIMGCAIVICSLFLHKSMFIYVGVMALALIIPLNKYLITGSIIVFPFLYKLVVYVSLMVLQFGLANEQSVLSGTNYLESDDISYGTNLNGYLRAIITKLPFYLLLVYSVWKVYFSKKKEKVGFVFKVFLQYTFLLVYISHLFLGQPVSKFLAPRFWDASIYTLLLFSAYFFYPRKQTRFVKNSINLLLIANIFNFAYMIFRLGK